MYTLFAQKRNDVGYGLTGDPIVVAVYPNLDETCKALRKLPKDDGFHYWADFQK